MKRVLLGTAIFITLLFALLFALPASAAAPSTPPTWTISGHTVIPLPGYSVAIPAQANTGGCAYFDGTGNLLGAICSGGGGAGASTTIAGLTPVNGVFKLLPGNSSLTVSTTSPGTITLTVSTSAIQSLLTVTTTGTSGAATYSGGTLNIPQYQATLTFPLAVNLGGTGSTSLNTTLVPEGTNLYFTNARAAGAISLTTTGTSGAATYNNSTGALNIPQYQAAGSYLTTIGSGSNGQIAVWNGTNSLTGVSTSTLTATSPLTGSFTQIGSGGSLGCQTASGSQAGCLSSSDWTTFNNKQAAGNYLLSTGFSASGTGLSVATTTGTVQYAWTNPGYYLPSNFIAGTNITITTSTPGQITIAAAGGGLSSYNVVSTNGLIGVSTSTNLATLTASTSPYFTNINASGTLNVSATSTLATTTVTNLSMSQLASCTNGVITGAAGLFACNSSAFLTSVSNSNWSGADLAVANGGTGYSFLTANDILYGAGASLATSSNLQFNGGNTLAITGSTTISNLLTVSGQTSLQTASATSLTVSGPLLVTGTSTLATSSVTNLTVSQAPTFSSITGSSQCLQVNTSGVVSGTGSACGGSGSTPGGSNGQAQYNLNGAFGGSAALLMNSSVVGINATSSTVALNVQGSGTLDPLNVASSSGTSYFAVKASGNVGVNTATPASALDVKGLPYNEAYNIGTTSAATLTINFNNGSKQSTVLATSTKISFSNVQPGATLTLFLIQDGGSRTTTFATSGPAIVWPGGTAPTLSTAAGTVDILNFQCMWNQCYGVSSTNYASSSNWVLP